MDRSPTRRDVAYAKMDKKLMLNECVVINDTGSSMTEVDGRFGRPFIKKRSRR
jgi:hypothetical protein